MRSSAKVKGKWGALAAAVSGVVGLVLFAMGFDGHTTEALPFGIGLMVVAAVVAWPSVRAIRTVLSPTSGEPRRLEEAGRDEPALPPSTVRCAHCGSPAPLMLSEPEHATCRHCGTRFSLPPELAGRLARAAEATKLQSESERHIGSVVASLVERESLFLRRLRWLTAALCILAAAVALTGWARRFQDDWWHAWVAFGAAATGVALVLFVAGAKLLRLVVRRVAGEWAALEAPGEPGLRCRVCGAALPDRAAAVLRCAYCGSDNLSSPTALARLRVAAVETQRSVLAAVQRHAAADEIAAFSVTAIPALTLSLWFGIGAVAGGVGLQPLGDLVLAPDPEARFAIVRVSGRGECVAAVAPAGGDVQLTFSYDLGARLSASRLPGCAAAAAIPADWLRGKRIAGRGEIRRVVRRLRSPGRHEAWLDGEMPVYLPSTSGGGELVCLESTGQGSGDALEPTAR